MSNLSETEIKTRTLEFIADMQIAVNALGRLRYSVLPPGGESIPGMVVLREIQNDLLCNLAEAVRSLTKHTNREEWDPTEARGQLAMLYTQCTHSLKHPLLAPDPERGQGEGLDKGAR